MKKQKWGPELLTERPRRNPGDNRNILQKAAELKSYQNLEIPAIKTGNSFAVLDPHYLAQVSSKVGVSLGSNDTTILANIGSMIRDENTKSSLFKEEFPEILLPSKLEVDKSLFDNSTCLADQGYEDIIPQPLLVQETWSQVVQKSIDAHKSTIVNDRCILEH